VIISRNPKSSFTTAAIAALPLLAALLLGLSRQAIAQSPETKISAAWQALGWSLPEDFSPEHLTLFKGLNAARGTWSFGAETVAGNATTAVTGKLTIKGGSQGGMASAWELVWSWPAENPQHAIIENIMAMPEENLQFGLMLVRFGPVKHSEIQPKMKPKAAPSIFMGKWDGEKQAISWAPQGRPGTPGNPTTKQKNAPTPAFEMVVAADGKISLTNSTNLPAGQITSGSATARTGDAGPEPEFLTGMHSFQKGSAISDPRITRYLPAAATDITLCSDRSGHWAHYQISAAAFDTFLTEVWERYQKERAAEPESWVDYSEENITKACAGSLVGRYEPKFRSSEIVFDKPIELQSLENATSYPGPRRMSHAGANYYFDRETGVAYHDAGYW